ncbi:MAG TPA: serine protease [Oligoflexus sp.]|uniref:S1 family peptidase n=1 Tax=Oligoflexus sp. TaxID=1971216 RepID=UPI002D6BB03F|nr:serine protease [Oligoflexus sp.]HYX37464.1 serine protease [Oligoflexus sp.]
MHRFSLLVVTVLFACQTSYNSKFQNEEGGFPEPSVLLKNAHGAHQPLASIGRLQGAMNCTAFLWKPAGASSSTSATALTNAHCVMPYTDRASSYEVWVNRAAPSSWNLVLNYFVDTPAARKTVQVQSIVYASMKAVDLAVVELNVSWAELEREGFQALPQASAPVRAGSAIQTVGIPEGNFPSEEQFLRAAHCVEETRVSVVEWFWTWFDTHRNGCADIQEGSSGSPVLNAQGEVYAVINTTSGTGISESCYLGNPCAMQRPGAFMVANKNYAIDIVGLDRCFAEKTLQFGSKCALPPPSTVSYRDALNTPTRPIDAQNQPIRWNVQAPGALWKLGPVGEVDCRDEDDYLKTPLPRTDLPRDNGVYLLCLLKAEADARFPTVVVLSIDTRPPTLKPDLAMRATDLGLTFEPIFQVPELSFFWIGFGPANSTRCESLTLAPYRRIPTRIRSQELPVKICVQGEDHAGNRGPLFDYLVTAQDVSALRSNVRPKSSGQKAKQHNVIRKE